MEVYPDFYSALLFSKLMGPEVLAATMSSGVQYSPKAYAHCARQKGFLSLLLFNFGNASVTAAIAPAVGTATGIYRLHGPCTATASVSTASCCGSAPTMGCRRWSRWRRAGRWCSRRWTSRS